MKSSISYKVVSKSDKETKAIQNLMAYIEKNFNVKGKRLGIPNFIKEFGKFNDDKETLQASSIPTVTQIQVACRLIASNTVDTQSSDIIPCVICKNGITTIETRNTTEFELYYPTLKARTKKQVTPTEFIINYLNKHVDEIDIKAIEVAIKGLK